MQDISSICTVLPGLPDDVHFAEVVKKYLQEGGQIASKMFVIRKQVVLDALRWLKQYNVEYANIQIEESNMDWIEKNVVQELPGDLIQMNEEVATKTCHHQLTWVHVKSKLYQAYREICILDLKLRVCWVCYSFIMFNGLLSFIWYMTCQSLYLYYV